MAPSDRRALTPRPRSGAHVPVAHLFSASSAPRYGGKFSFVPSGCLAGRAEAPCDRRLMSKIDLGIGTLAWPALIRHPRKKKR